MTTMTTVPATDATPSRHAWPTLRRLLTDWVDRLAAAAAPRSHRVAPGRHAHSRRGASARIRPTTGFTRVV